jgi:hypothetical protein
MNRIVRRIAAILVLAGAVAAASGAFAQVSSLFYREIEKDGRIYVFNTLEKYKAFQASGDMGIAITLIGQGPNGETVVAENETAIDLYNLKHDRPAYERAAPKPAVTPPGPPTSIKVGDGEIKLGALLQAWYVADDSPVNTGATSFYGNTVGENTFRLRRAEIALKGNIVKGWGFEVMFDPAKAINTAAGADGKILQDLAVVYSGPKGHEFMLGQKKIYLTEEGVHSSSDLDFAERAQVTRTFSDRRETGFFWHGDWTEQVATWVSITNGTASNVNDDSNDTVVWSGRLDVKPVHGLLVGGSGSYSGGEGLAHLSRSRYGAHVRYDRTADLPVDFRFEYLRATDGQAGKADLRRDGWYATAMYTALEHYQVGVRYDELNRNKDADGNKTKTFTAGFHYLVKGRNANLKLDWYHVKEEGRKINGALDESYNQLVLAAQVAF